MKKLKNRLIEKTIKPAIEFFKNIAKKRVIILHDEDCDGICSGAIIGKLLVKKKCKVKLLAMHPDSPNPEIIWKEINNHNPEIVVILDIPSISQESINALKFSQILIIDHHMPRKYSNCVYVNPRVFDKKVYIPTSCICYEIYRNFFDENEICWIAGIGILGDFGVKSCRHVFRKIKLIHPELVDKRIEQKELFENTLLGTLTKVVDSSRVVMREKGARIASKFLMGVSDWREIFKFEKSESKKLIKWYLLSRFELERLKKNFEKRKIVKKDKILYIFSSQFKLKSTLATHLSQKYRKKIIIIAQEEKGYLNVSLRRGKDSKVDLNLLIKKLKEKVPELEGGGHPQAAAFKVPLKYRELIICYLGF